MWLCFFSSMLFEESFEKSFKCSWIQNACHCIRAPPRGGRDWKIHPRRPRFPETQEISRGRSPREISRVEGNLERFPAAMGFAPRDPRDFPRAKPEGNPEGRGVQNPWPREISRAEGMDFPIPPESWWSTDILSSLPGKDWLTTSYFILHTVLLSRPLVVAS